jgi:hypothetical protein
MQESHPAEFRQPPALITGLKLRQLNLPSDNVRRLGAILIAFVVLLETRSAEFPNDVPLARSYNVKPGETTSQIIWRQFGVSYGEDRYYDIERSIVALNDLHSPDRIPVRTILIPGSTNTLSRASRTSTASVAATALGDFANTIRVRIPASAIYSEGGKEMFSALVDALPPRSITVVEGESLSSIIKNEYGLAYTQDHSRLIEHAILKLNKLPTPEKLQIGTCLVPSLPKRIATNGMRLAQPGTMFLGETRNVKPAFPKAIETVAFTHAFASSDTHPAGYTTYINASLPTSSALKLKGFPVIWTNSHFENFKLKIRLAQSASNTAANIMILNAEEVADLENSFRAKTRSKTLLFVQDTGWPDEDSMRESCRIVFELFDLVWTNGFGVTAPKRSGVPKFVQPKDPHCIRVRNALRQLTSIEKTRLVLPVFVPLTRDQGSEKLLIELLQIGRLLQDFKLRSRLRPNAEIIKVARRAAIDTVHGNVPLAWRSRVEYVDNAVVESLINLGSAVAALSGRYVVFNQSWTVDETSSFPTRIPMPLNGVIVAAAGNESGEDFIKSKRDFAQRCAFTKDTVAVLNVRRGGVREIKSSDALTDYDIHALVVGFDGDIEDNETGTSFAAPRVAWLIAAAESLRNGEMPPYLWADRLVTALTNGRKPKKAPDELWISPLSILHAFSGN